MITLKLKPDLAASEPTTDGIMQDLGALDLKGRRIGVQLYGTEPNLKLIEFLNRRGATADCVAPYIYADAAEDARVRDLIAQLGDGQVDAIAFTSQLNWWAHGRLNPGMSYQVWVVKPGTLFSPPQSIDQLPGSGVTVDDPSLSPEPRFFFGQIDPNDPSRFTIRYRAFGQDDVVDGSIDDAGQVTLTQRKPPTL